MKRHGITLITMVALCSCGKTGANPDAGQPDAALPDMSFTSDMGPDMSDECAPEPGLEGARSIEDPRGTFSVTVSDDGCARTYRLSSTAERRDGLPENPRVVAELSGWPRLRSGSAVLDGLYAMTMEEVRENSVDAISDGSFNDGEPIDCPDGGCFETGEKWKYVWTRDISYALDLGLAALDPLRAKNSLLFKLSTRRDGTDLQVMQDTGTGGSYPVSTDRVVWAVGARAVAAELTGDDRSAFVEQAGMALQNTLTHDREVVWDERSGLYRGEQSFLDWREQSYPTWVAGDPTHIATSRALSTNLLHWHALETVGLFDPAASPDYGSWADGLRADLDRFWLADESRLSAFFVTQLDEAPSRQYDLLGTALAIELGAMPERADALLENYPHYGVGAPVLFPQQQFTPIYHNRAEWPFVSAYWLRAASGRNAKVADRMIETLVRGAALNLSNMENWEADSGEPWVEDGEYSGPVVNSRRQLWSVAAFVSMVHQSIFGISTHFDGTSPSLTIQPALPRTVRQAYFPDSDRIVLRDYPHAGRAVDVVLELPVDDEEAPAGFYDVVSAKLDGRPYQAGDPIPTADLAEGAVLTIELGLPEQATESALTAVDSADWTNVFGPRPPVVTLDEDGGNVRVSWVGEEEADVSWTVIRDGDVVATAEPGQTSWTDPDQPVDGPSACYVVESCFAGSGNCSQHSQPTCWWGLDDERITVFPAAQLENAGGALSSQYGKEHWSEWGDDGHTLALSGWTADATGTHLLQVEYGNGAGGVTTGITCAVKRVDVIDESTGQSIGGGYIVMPHLGDWGTWGFSTLVEVDVDAATSYRVELTNDEYSINMSSFDHFAAYAGEGGAAPFARANIAALRVLW